MLIKVYQKYLIREFLTNVFKISFVFFILGLIMGILEELEYFSDYDLNLYYTIFFVLTDICDKVITNTPNKKIFILNNLKPTLILDFKIKKHAIILIIGTYNGKKILLYIS